MPATRTRASTEQAAEVAAEEVKQVQEEAKEIVDAPVVSEEVAASEAVAEQVVSEPVVEGDAVPEVPVEESNGVSEAVAETNNGVSESNGNGVSVDEVEEEAVDGKRKSEVITGGEGDVVPDSTEVPVKKQKVIEEEVAVVEESAPVVDA